MAVVYTALAYGTAIAVWFPLGALLATKVHLSHGVIAASMSLGAGLLLAAACIDLTSAALEGAGAIGGVAVILLGASVFSVINWRVSQGGAANRKRCGGCVAQATEDETPGSGRAIAIGTVLDAIPEALVLGVVLSASGQAIALVVALALGNLAQAISSTTGLIHAGRSTAFVTKLWCGLAVLVIATTLASATAFGAAGDTVRPWIEAFAAGILIAMTCEAMLPEAFHKNPSFRGIQAAAGVCAFALLHHFI